MLLKRGDNNEQVKQLQVKLGLEPIGNFGPKTEEAVKAFQTDLAKLQAERARQDAMWQTPIKADDGANIVNHTVNKVVCYNTNNFSILNQGPS